MSVRGLSGGALVGLLFIVSVEFVHPRLSLTRTLRATLGISNYARWALAIICLCGLLALAAKPDGPVAPAPPRLAALAFLWRQVGFAAEAGPLHRIDGERRVEQRLQIFFCGCAVHDRATQFRRAAGRRA
jgi:hypothetical protein